MKFIAIALVGMISVGFGGCRPDIESRWISSHTTETVDLPDGGKIVTIALPDGNKRVLIFDKHGNVAKHDGADKLFEARAPVQTTDMTRYVPTPVVVAATQAPVHVHREHHASVDRGNRECRMKDGRKGGEIVQGGKLGCSAPRH